MRIWLDIPDDILQTELTPEQLAAEVRFGAVQFLTMYRRVRLHDEDLRRIVARAETQETPRQSSATPTQSERSVWDQIRDNAKSIRSETVVMEDGGPSAPKDDR